MFEDSNNLKDVGRNISTSYGAGHSDLSVTIDISYTKTNKLITALFMVTDIMDKDEPLRNKLRTLGSEIISDTHLIQSGHIGHVASLVEKISEIMSFLDIASAVNIISQMNTNILKKEFTELDRSAKESINKNEIKKSHINI